MANSKNLKNFTHEERVANGRKGGIASGEARNEAKSMRETAKKLLNMEVVGESNKRNLARIGIPENDQNYKTAIVVRLMDRALSEGDTHAIKLLSELAGEFSGKDIIDADEVVDFEYPAINIPDNGRNKRKTNVLQPQAGPQTAFMASKADIVIYGGAAGGGKTYALLLEGLRHKDVSGFGGIIFRREYNQISAEGGLWDASHKIYDLVPDAHAGKTPRLHWDFDSGAKLSFAYIGSGEGVMSWQGTEICYLAFDELTHFSRKQFLYMLSRNRSTCGIKPYVRATCNPDSESWVAEFIEWWIDQKTGYPIPERSGQIRYMCVLNDTIYFASTAEELAEEYDVEVQDCKSVTFIASRLEDNKVLMETDPGYMANLKALMEVERERLLLGNWKIKAAAGMFFKRSQVTMIESIPRDVITWARGWDLAATAEDEKGDPAYTASVLIGKRRNGNYVIADVTNQRLSADEVRQHIKTTCQMDKQKYKHVVERLPKDPGQAGKAQAESFIKFLAGFVVKTIPESGSKETRAEPLAAQWQHGNVEVLLANWNDMYFGQLESFPEAKFKDMVDASSSAFAEIENGYSTTPPPGGLSKESYWNK